jgi:hypothetical protein
MPAHHSRDARFVLPAHFAATCHSQQAIAFKNPLKAVDN